MKLIYFFKKSMLVKLEMFFYDYLFKKL